MSSRAQTDGYFTDRADAMARSMPDYVRRYIRSIRNSTSPRTRYEYLKDIARFLAHVEGSLGHAPSLPELGALDKGFFEGYMEYMEHYEEDGTERTNGRTSLKRKLSSLRRFFGYLFGEGLIESDQVRRVEMPKPHRKEIVRLEQDEARDFLFAVEHGEGLTKKESDYHRRQRARDMAIATLLLSTGMRVSECAELDMGDIDLERCMARIVRKGGDESIVYFSDEAAGRLSDWLDARAAMKGGDGEKALFLSSRGQRMSVRAIEYMVGKYASRAVPLKRITPHKLRSTFATELYNGTGDIYLVAEALGHKDVATTKEHYAHLSEGRKMDARNVVSYGQGKGGPDACAQRPAPGPS